MQQQNHQPTNFTLDDLVYTFMVNSGMTKDPVQSFKKQTNQLNEELQELRDDLVAKDDVKIWDAVGDVTFVITSLEILRNLSENDSECPDMVARQGAAELMMLMAKHELPTFLSQIAGSIAAESNLTKFDDTEEDALKTKQHYFDTFELLTEVRQVEETGTFTVVVVGDQSTGTISAHDGKIMKSAGNYIPPNFTKLAQDHPAQYVVRVPSYIGADI